MTTNTTRRGFLRRLTVGLAAAAAAPAVLAEEEGGLTWDVAGSTTVDTGEILTGAIDVDTGLTYTEAYCAPLPERKAMPGSLWRDKRTDTLYMMRDSGWTRV